MSSYRLFDYRFVTSILLSFGIGMALLLAMPVLTKNPLFLFGLPVMGCAMLMLVIKPKETFILLFFLRPLLDNFLNRTRIGSGEGIGLGAGLNLALIILTIYIIFQSGGFPRRNKVITFWVVFLLVLLASTLYSPYLTRAIRLYFNHISYFSMFLLPFLLVKTREDFLFWLKLFALSFIVPILFANIDMIQGGRHYADAGNRIIGTFTYPTILGFYLVLGFTLYFYILKSGLYKISPKIAWIMKALMLNMLVLMIATKTRNAWIAFAAIIFIYGFLKDKKTLLIFCLLLPFSLFVPAVQERVLTVISDKQVIDYEGMNSFEWRLRMWKSSLPFIAQKPLQGYGLTSFRPLSINFADSRNIGAMGAHNIYIEILFETGLFGLLSYLAIVFSLLSIFFKNMLQSVNSVHARLWAIVVGYLASFIIICSADNLTYYLVLNWYIWFFLGLMVVSKQFLVPEPRHSVQAPQP